MTCGGIVGVGLRADLSGVLRADEFVEIRRDPPQGAHHARTIEPDKLRVQAEIHDRRLPTLRLLTPADALPERSDIGRQLVHQRGGRLLFAEPTHLYGHSGRFGAARS